eukprot:14634-Heterococcus_DN1.PRE.2
MAQREVPPILRSCCAAMSACSKGGQWQRAVQSLHEMQEQCTTPSIRTYVCCFKLLEKSGAPSIWEALQEWTLFGQQCFCCFQCCALRFFEQGGDDTVSLPSQQVSVNELTQARVPVRIKDCSLHQSK